MSVKPKQSAAVSKPSVTQTQPPPSSQSHHPKKKQEIKKQFSFSILQNQLTKNTSDSFLIVKDFLDDLMTNKMDEFLRNKYLYLKIPDNTVNNTLALCLILTEAKLKIIEQVNQWDKTDPCDLEEPVKYIKFYQNQIQTSCGMDSYMREKARVKNDQFEMRTNTLVFLEIQKPKIKIKRIKRQSIDRSRSPSPRNQIKNIQDNYSISKNGQLMNQKQSNTIPLPKIKMTQDEIIQQAMVDHLREELVKKEQEEKILKANPQKKMRISSFLQTKYYMNFTSDHNGKPLKIKRIDYENDISLTFDHTLQNKNTEDQLQFKTPTDHENVLY